MPVASSVLCLGQKDIQCKNNLGLGERSGYFVSQAAFCQHERRVSFWKHFPPCELVHTGRAILQTQITSWENQLATSFKMKPWRTHPSFLEMCFGRMANTQIHWCVLAVQRWQKCGFFSGLLCIYHCCASMKQHKAPTTNSLKGSRNSFTRKIYSSNSIHLPAGSRCAVTLIRFYFVHIRIRWKKKVTNIQTLK